ncbi:MAG TPA: pyrroline-5-carboxylate reductase [Nitrospiraceae bacterium]|nr:pyrroline-5-carboxylate reductase [Nitrospiraceae bacterium]
MAKSARRTTIAMIGSGQMGEALIGGWLAAKTVSADALFATDASAERRDLMKRRFGVRVGSGNREAASWADVVVLAVKPQILDGVMKDLSPALADKLVLSIAAGVTIAHLAKLAPKNTRVVRAMPNMPVLVRDGVSALSFGAGVTDKDQQFARRLFDAVGRAVVVEEKLMDAVTGLSGSGPAYVFLAIEALADGGVKMGLPRTVSDLLAAQTVLGAARMVLETGEHPAKLKDRVASPGGTTIAGLHRLEQGGLRAALMAAVEAASKRSEELGRETKH